MNGSCAALLVLAFVGCTSSPSTLVADDTVAVMEKPSPADYPSTNPIPNTVIAMLAKGERIKVKDTGYNKDFMYHEVVLPDGRRRYVIGRPILELRIPFAGSPSAHRFALRHPDSTHPSWTVKNQ